MKMLRIRITKSVLGLISALIMAILLVVLTGCAASPEPDSLRVAAQPIVNIDPAFIASDSEVMVANAVYDYLVDVDERNQIQPRLALDWEVGADGLTWTFTLTKDAAFHDGSQLTAADVVWTFSRLRDTEGLPTQSLYQNIVTIEAINEHQVRFVLSEPNPFFLFDLTDNHALILQEGTLDADQNLNGTGPFKLVEYQPGSGGRVLLEANDDYFIKDQPKIRSLEILFFDDEVAELNALRSGQVDIITQVSTPLFQSMQELEGIETFEVATNAFPILRLRTDQPPGDDPKIMRAMKSAIDREGIFDLVQHGYGAIGRDHPVGPLYLEQGLYAPDIQALEKDLARSRQLLAEAGYEDGLQLTLELPEAQNFPDLAVVLKEQLAEIGIELEIVVYPESVYYGGSDWMDANFGITGWGSRPYPQFYLEVMLTCDGQWNESRFCDSEFDQLVSIAGSSMDEAERREAYHQIQEILVERGPIVVPFFFAQLGAQRDSVEGFQMKPFPGRSDFRPVTIKPSG